MSIITKMSESGREMLKKFEGLRLTAYQCAAGVWTIGYGHTQNVTPAMTITQADADKFLLDDLLYFEHHVYSYDEIYHWNQNEFDAMVSFAFNVGSISVLTEKGTLPKSWITDRMKNYVYANRKKLPGLVNRRKTECELFKKTDGTPYPAYSGTSEKIDDVMYDIGAYRDYADFKPTYKNRKPIATANGIDNYTGTAEQNIRLIGLAKKGELKRP